jgi:hypothetical protein
MDRKLYSHNFRGVYRTISLDKDFINIEIYKLDLPEVDSDAYSSLYNSFMNVVELENKLTIHESKYNVYFMLESFNYYIEPGPNMITLHTLDSTLIRSNTPRLATDEEIYSLKSYIRNIFYSSIHHDKQSIPWI